MSLGQNLQFLRKMHNHMTQEALAEKLGVSRQAISKWESDAAYPEINAIKDLCLFFSCSMDQLILTDMNMLDAAYSHIRCQWVEAFSYLPYTVISTQPEEDALVHIRSLAEKYSLPNPLIIGWDFPSVTQEQANLFHMHGYTAALILEELIPMPAHSSEICFQE